MVRFHQPHFPSLVGSDFAKNWQRRADAERGQHRILDLHLFDFPTC